MPAPTDWDCPHVPERYIGRTLESVDPAAGAVVQRALAAARELLAGKVETLLLSGPVGCGKTLIAAAIANGMAAPLWQAWLSAQERFEELRDAHVGGYVAIQDAMAAAHRAERRLHSACPRWVSVPTTLSALRRELDGSDRPRASELRKVVESRGLLVLDDIGIGTTSEWSLEVLFDLVNGRYERGLPIVATTNLRTSELVTAGLERLVSRLSERGVTVSMAGAKDYRLRMRRSA